MGSDLQLRNVTLDPLKYYNIIVKYFLHTVFFVNKVLLEENSDTHKHIVSAYCFLLQVLTIWKETVKTPSLNVYY